MFRAADNLILNRLTQAYEIGAVPSYPHDEIPVFLRVYLAVHQHVLVDDIELNMLASLAEVGPNEHG